MSVVAGVSLLDGVLIGADCRITYGNGSRRTYRDELQKLIPIGKHTVISLTGHVATAAKLLVAVKKAQEGENSIEELRWTTFLNGPNWVDFRTPKARKT